MYCMCLALAERMLWCYIFARLSDADFGLARRRGCTSDDACCGMFPMPPATPVGLINTHV